MEKFIGGKINLQTRRIIILWPTDFKDLNKLCGGGKEKKGREEGKGGEVGADKNKLFHSWRKVLSHENRVFQESFLRKRG